MLDFNTAIIQLRKWAEKEKLVLCLLVFGSYAKGTAHENSDLDIAIITDSEPGDMDDHVAFSYNKQRWVKSLQTLLEFSHIHLEWFDYNGDTTEQLRKYIHEARIVVYVAPSFQTAFF